MKQIKQLSIWIIALAGWMIATGAVQAKDYDFKHDGLYYKITQAIPPRQVKVVSENAYQPYYSAGNERHGRRNRPEKLFPKGGNLYLHLHRHGDRKQGFLMVHQDNECLDPRRNNPDRRLCFLELHGTEEHYDPRQRKNNWMEGFYVLRNPEKRDPPQRHTGDRRGGF